MLICFPGDFDLKHSVLQGVRSIKPLRLVQWPTAFEMSASSEKSNHLRELRVLDRSLLPLDLFLINADESNPLLIETDSLSLYLVRLMTHDEY